jgi:O-antigen ligase
VRQVLAAMVVYGLMVFCVTGSRERFVLVGIVIAGAFAQAALGFYQYLAPEARLHLGWVTMLCPDHMDMHEFRARGFYYNANHLAWLLNIAGAFSLAIAVWGRTGVWWRAGLLYAAAVFFGLGILTQSRGGFAGTAAALAVVFLLGCRALIFGAMGRRGRRLGVLGLALAAVLGAGWLAWSSSDLAQYRFLTAADEGYRWNVWKTAWRLWQTEPLAGTGAGTFALASRSLRFQADALDDICAHNDWVQGLAELGLIGIGLALCVVVLHFAAGWRAFGEEWRRGSAAGGGGSLRAAMQAGALAALAACVVHSFFDFNMQVPANLLLLAMVLGILASPGRVGGERAASGFLPKAGVLAVAGLGVALAVVVWHCHRAETAWILADKALREGRPGDAEKWARSGLAANPAHARLADAGGRAMFLLATEGEIRDDERARRFAESAGLFRQAADLDGRDAWNLLNLAHALDNREVDGGTVPLYLRAIESAPFFAAPYEFFGLALEKSGDLGGAIRLYGLAASLPGSTFSGERRRALMELESEREKTR